MNLIECGPPPESNADLIRVLTDQVTSLKSLADVSKAQADASKAQADAVIAQADATRAHHRMPEMRQPYFDPNQCRVDSLAFKTFWDQFELFAATV